ncbi:MAG: DUF3581 domain-containing protein, partial [Kangiellaceae bacterium]|nr:DUF3581 domain-containing protein [Kangiellaceae bacterium]
MFVTEYYNQADQSITISRQQASDFAKSIAGDFNPIHDPDNKRFCVPGDLLFSMSLTKYGVSESMSFDFQGMVGGDAEIHFEESDNQLMIKNEKDKTFLTVERDGNVTHSETFIDGLIRSYVAFSGKTFPHILVELMQEEGVMPHPDRPMVIYDLMKIKFERFSESAPEVVLLNRTLDVDGKRGMVTMKFDIQADGGSIGSGEKQIIMSGLREYEQSGIDTIVSNYE